MFAIQVGKGSMTPGQKVFRYVSPIDGTVTEFLPERGMVTLHYEKKGEEFFVRETRAEFVARMVALSHEAKLKHKYPRERKALLDLVEMMLEVNRRCKAQGDPLDPEVLRQMRRKVLPCRVMPRGLALPASYLPGLPAADPRKPVIDMSDSPAQPPPRIVLG
jgi:hypothetical protein